MKLWLLCRDAKELCSPRASCCWGLCLAGSLHGSSISVQRTRVFFQPELLQGCKIRALLLPRLHVDPLCNFCPSLSNGCKDGAIPAVSSQDPCKKNAQEGQRQGMGGFQGILFSRTPHCGFQWETDSPVFCFQGTASHPSLHPGHGQAAGAARWLAGPRVHPILGGQRECRVL